MTFFKSWRTRIALVLAVVGPGFITANVDNDAGGIATYSVAGAQFGYSLLWTMIPITIALVIVQEMSSRMGAVTGKGLSDLILEEFGIRATFLLMIAAGWVHRHQLIVIEFFQAENRLPKDRLRGRCIRFTDAERALLARKAKAVGRKALLELDTVVSPDTLMRWHRRLLNQRRQSCGR